MRAAIRFSARLVAVAQDAAAAVAAYRRELLDRALEAVEDVVVAARAGHTERLVVAVAADLAGTHCFSYAARRLRCARFGLCSFSAALRPPPSTLFLRSDIRSMTSAPLVA